MKVLRNELEILYVAVVFIVHTIASKNYYLSIIQLHIDHYFNTKPIKKNTHFTLKKKTKITFILSCTSTLNFVHCLLREDPNCDPEEDTVGS